MASFIKAPPLWSLVAQADTASAVMASSPGILNVTTDVTTSRWDDFAANGTNSSGPPGTPPDISDILMLYSEYRWSRYVGLYGYPIMIVVGLVGNLLSMLVMRRRPMLVSSTCFYMAALALADILVMIFGCLRKWLTFLNGWDAVILSPAACGQQGGYCS